MNIQRPLMPGFLKKAEQQLLLNKPAIWSTRVHLVGYYGLLFIAVLALLCFLEPVDLRNKTTTAAWVGFVSIISVIGLTVWLIYLLRFNVFKKYGNISPLYMLGTFLLYFVCTGIIVLFTYVHPVVESVRANLAYDGEELVKDMNDINLKIGQLEFNNLQVKWEYDSVAFAKDKKITEAEPEYYREEKPGEARRIPFLRLDSSSFFSRMESADSLKKINDTLYLMYRTPGYDFLSVYDASKFTRENLNSSFDIYHYVKAHLPNAAERTIITKQLSVLLKKYDLPERRVHSPYEPEPTEPFRKVFRKYRIDSVDDSFENIVDKKYRWMGHDRESFIRVFYYCTLVISLLIFLFRHSTTRTFFLTLLTGLLLIIFTALLDSFGRLNDLQLLGVIIGYILLFFAGSLMVWRNKKRIAITGILINLLLPAVLVLPPLLLAFYHDWRHRRYVNDVEVSPMRVEDWMIVTAEVTGACLLVVLLLTYFYRLYRRWYALPEH